MPDLLAGCDFEDPPASSQEKQTRPRARRHPNWFKPVRLFVIRRRYVSISYADSGDRRGLAVVGRGASSRRGHPCRSTPAFGVRGACGGGLRGRRHHSRRRRGRRFGVRGGGEGQRRAWRPVYRFPRGSSVRPKGLALAVAVCCMTEYLAYHGSSLPFRSQRATFPGGSRAV